ncbi:hypothetical protein AAVH_31627 [Aphelenchoides avenae]|nr:hypothetical protein AAVH_31627 [Aphelenchus avenae]
MLTAGGKASANELENVHHDVEEVHDVESIVGTQAVSRQRFYLIKWVDDDALTWEPVGNLESGSVRAVAAFKKAMGWSRLPQGDAMYLRADVKEEHDDGDTKYVLTGKKRKSAEDSCHISSKKRARTHKSATKLTSSAESTRGTELVDVAFKAPPLEPKAQEEQLHTPADDSGFASDISLSEDADSTNIDAIIEWVLPADGGFITPAASRSTTPMPKSPAKDEHWFNASFNVDLVCPFPEEMTIVAPNPQNSPMSEDQEHAVTTPTFSSMDDFKKHMSAALSQPLFVNAWMSLYDRNAQWRD